MNYYRKPINKIANDVKLDMQLGALTLKISEYNDKIDNLLKVDENIKKDVSNNATKIENISSNLIKLIFNENYIIENQNFESNKNFHFFNILEVNLKNDFKIGDIVKIAANISYKYNNIKNDYHRLEHEYNIYADNVLFLKKL